MVAPDELPLDISDDEKLARAIFEPFHIKKGKLKSAAFKAPAGRRDVSVNRVRALKPDECKKKAKAIGNAAKIYQGFAVLTAEVIRELGSDVEDSREEPMYFGHADIIHDIVLEKGQSAPPEFNLKLQQMAKRSTFYSDPKPDEDTWEGDDFS